MTHLVTYSDTFRLINHPFLGSFVLIHIIDRPKFIFFTMSCYAVFFARLTLVSESGLIIPILDEKSFQTFAIYCGLALHHAKVCKTVLVHRVHLKKVFNSMIAS